MSVNKENLTIVVDKRNFIQKMIAKIRYKRINVIYNKHLYPLYRYSDTRILESIRRGELMIYQDFDVSNLVHIVVGDGFSDFKDLPKTEAYIGKDDIIDTSNKSDLDIKMHKLYEKETKEDIFDTIYYMTFIVIYPHNRNFDDMWKSYKKWHKNDHKEFSIMKNLIMGSQYRRYEYLFDMLPYGLLLSHDNIVFIRERLQFIEKLILDRRLYCNHVYLKELRRWINKYNSYLVWMDENEIV